MKTIIINAVAIAAAGFCLFTININAQPPGYNEIPILRGVSFDRLNCWRDPKREELTFIGSAKEKCESSVRYLAVDSDRETIVYWSAASDCHMRVAVRVIRSDQEKRVRVILNNIYGGCSAGGRRSGVLVIEKPPSDFLISVEEIAVDRIHGRDDEKYVFIFPLI